MAEVINTEPARTTQPRYPWDEWTDGRTWVATEGVDFDVTAANFRAQLHVKASKLAGKKVTTSVDGNKVTFRFYEVPEETQ